MTLSDKKRTSSSSTQALQALTYLRSQVPPSDTQSRIQDLVCFAHLRWNFVYQRPQHLLSRAAQQWRVWYVEEPIWGDSLYLDIHSVDENIRVVVPHLPHGLDEESTIRLQRQLVDQLLEQQEITNFITWYYTPMALLFSDHLQANLVIYDCMDELSAFKGASPRLLQEEKRLLSRADLVFTGGYSLYEAKLSRHERVFAFPSCIDYDHFVRARHGMADPADQRDIAPQRIGFSGVLDERLDIELLGALAQQLPDWQFILLGPVVKIDPATLPQGPNLHYLGMKNYKELPAYFSNWDIAMMPFAHNEATRFISPTKTPEYLAAGLPVVSTSICDVKRTYCSWEQVQLADSAEAMGTAIRQAVQQGQKADWMSLDAFLREQSWENTWQQMQRLLYAQLIYAQV
ncbi:glycosyltransferase family 1 protein [Spirosoma sp. KNUC1025]|uniref:glycosyltransferase family 1 protein n=1 Tax=Spirosoma sp. KNUC1025 TaxID=2894082 RepID=UPI0038661940|nr:glycosyltransferase family 1 protein [Spirosoma sp. KNUC1025]